MNPVVRFGLAVLRAFCVVLCSATLLSAAPALSDHPKPAIYDHLKTGHMETYSGTLTAA
jgi:hypothetical protein